MALTGESHPVFGVNGAAATGTTTIVSESTVPRGQGNVSYQVKITETTPTVAGTMLVQTSNSPRRVTDALANWDTYSPVTVPAISGAGQFTLKLTDMAVSRIRLTYTNATGVGVVTADVVRG